jgi:purine-nucleoside phosphorylase
MSGPSYETPAEVRMLRILGADLVGMSTVHEVIAARHAGLAVLGLSMVANPAAGIQVAPLSHEDVTAAAAAGAARMGELLEAVVTRLPLAAS